MGAGAPALINAGVCLFVLLMVILFVQHQESARDHARDQNIKKRKASAVELQGDIAESIIVT